MAAIWPGTLLVVYLSVTAAILFVGHARVSALAIGAHVTVLLALGAITYMRAVPSWLRAWAPLLLLLFLYSEMPAIIAAAGHAQLLDPRVIAWEAALFGGQPALLWAAAWPSTLFSELVHLAYLLYYPVIFAVPAMLYLRGRRDEFHLAVAVLLATFILCFLSYAAFPVAGPRYLWESTAPDGPFRRLALFLLESRSSQGTAFPSSHVAVATTQAVLAAALFGRRALWFGMVAAGIAIGAVYGGFHYALDVAAGAVLGIVVPFVGLRLSRAARDPQTR